ncbi:Na+/H+ antiporter family protein [Eubacterium nodatum ATCC 33099]|nr:Na+/H+ antiporter family protein [Eubacterium nodatum ATCC 33099]
MKGIIKFLPVFVLAFLMAWMKQDALVAAPVATITAVVIARLTEGIKFQECIEASVESVKNILIALFILMFAYAMASAFMTTGVGASVINLALKAGITAKSVAVVGIAVTAVLSVATGTSWGTFAACAPIFLWLCHIVDPNAAQDGCLLLTTCAIAGGACFGDNIGLISDTTIVSSGIQGVEVVDRVRTQGLWSLSCLVLAIIAFVIAGIVMGLPSNHVDTSGVLETIPKSAIDYLTKERPQAVDLLNQVGSNAKVDVPTYMILPLIIVIGLAVSGVSTFACIGSGIVSAYLLGLVAGTTSFSGGGFQKYVDLVMQGFADAGSWVIVMMMWVAAFGGIMGRMKAFHPLAKAIVSISRNVRQLMFWNGVLCIGGNAVLSDEMAQIVTIGPIIKDIAEENIEASEEDMYKIKLRNATFGDAMGVFGSQLIPWHVYLGFYVGIAANVYPLYKFANTDFIKYNFMAMIAVASLLILTFTGLDRFIPMFRLPAEPDVRLKKTN